MTSKKELIIAVLSTFCLTATLFMIMPTRSSSAERQYDPWCDINDDGEIDMINDIRSVAILFGTYGDPTKNVNVTNWPIDNQGNLKVKIIHNTKEWSVSIIQNYPGANWFSNTTRGYRQISFWCEADNTCTISVQWFGGGYQVETINVNAWTDYGREYDVLGPEIRIRTYSSHSAIQIWFSFYMTT